LEDLLADPNNFIEDLESKEDIDILKKAINKLPDKMKKIIELRLNNKTQKEIAKVLNITSSYISRLGKKLLKD
ncbi:sigma-70 family RNA polymerase sigma factor, partial [Clostridium botulinum]